MEQKICHRKTCHLIGHLNRILFTWSKGILRSVLLCFRTTQHRSKKKNHLSVNSPSNMQVLRMRVCHPFTRRTHSQSVELWAESQRTCCALSRPCQITLARAVQSLCETVHSISGWNKIWGQEDLKSCKRGFPRHYNLR